MRPLYWVFFRSVSGSWPGAKAWTLHMMPFHISTHCCFASRLCTKLARFASLLLDLFLKLTSVREFEIKIETENRNLKDKCMRIESTESTCKSPTPSRVFKRDLLYCLV